jgi:hypothetical protein
LIAENDKGVPGKEDRPTKRILKTLLTLNTEEARSKHHIKQKPIKLIQKSLKVHTFLYN